MRPTNLQSPQSSTHHKVFLISRVVFLSFLIVTILTSLTPKLIAQKSVAAPLPSQLLSARSVFLGNAGFYGNDFSRMVYDDLYHQLTNWKRFALVSTPGEADLALEIELLTWNGVTQGDSIGSNFLHLVIRDVKTHVIIWSISEYIKGAARSATYKKNAEEAVTKLVDDLKVLTTPSSTAVTSP